MTTPPSPPPSRARLVGRLVWIAVRLGLAIVVMQKGTYFLYQGF